MIRVPVQTFNRIANAVGDDISRPWCHGVMIETTVGGKVFATASDGKILACELTGFVQNLPESETIIRPIPHHKSGDVVIFPVPLGQPGNPTIYVEKDGMPIEFLQAIPDRFIDWRRSNIAFPKAPPKKPIIPVSFEMRYIAKLLATTPSGSVVFPEYIDQNSSIVVNDPDVPEWFGLFLPIKDNDKKNLQPAILPGWFE